MAGKARKTKYEHGFAYGVNCRCTTCSGRRKSYKAASRKLRWVRKDADPLGHRNKSFNTRYHLERTVRRLEKKRGK